jgi:hypothetical protein
VLYEEIYVHVSYKTSRCVVLQILRGCQYKYGRSYGDGNMRNRKESQAVAKRIFGNMVGAHTPMELFEKLRRNVVVADFKMRWLVERRRAPCQA